MHDLYQPLRMPVSAMPRDAGQRAAFGNFCLNAASFPLPAAIEHRSTGKYNLHFIRRKFFGVRSPIVNALVEARGTGSQDDIWRAADAALQLMSDADPPDVVKLFLAGSARDHAPQVGRAGNDAGYQGVFLPSYAPEALELPDSYDAFLRGLGRHTRRDMRRVRRDAQKAGFVFQFCAAARSGALERHRLGYETHPRRYRPEQIDAYDAFLSVQEQGFHALLRSREGQLLSCCAGFIAEGTAYVLYQLNHRGYRSASLSLTNRSYTLEHLIALGVREFTLPGGGSGILIHAARLRQNGELILIRRSPGPMLKALGVTILRPQAAVGDAVRRLIADRLRFARRP